MRKTRSSILERALEKVPFHFYFIQVLTTITVIFFIFRILIYIFPLPESIEYFKDVDFNTLHKAFQQNGLLNFYDPIDGWPIYYLYFWYFIFFPIGIIPAEIGVYFWDILRLVLVSLVIYDASKFFKRNTNDRFIFYILVAIGFGFDGWYNNVNFLLLFFLYYSYKYLEQGQKWISGIFFTLASFKINAILFLPVLFIAKKMKLKDLLYYFIPLGLLFIPYIIYPDYFIQMVNNWFNPGPNSSPENEGNIFFILNSLLWRVMTPPHLLFLSLFYFIIFSRIGESKRKDRQRFLIFGILIGYYIYYYLTVVIFAS